MDAPKKIKLHPNASDFLFENFAILRRIFSDVLGQLDIDYISIALINKVKSTLPVWHHIIAVFCMASGLMPIKVLMTFTIKLIPYLQAKPEGMVENKKVARRGGVVAGKARKETEKEIGKSVISSENYLQLEKTKKVPKLNKAVKIKN